MTAALLWTYHTGTALVAGSLLTFVVGSILGAQESTTSCAQGGSSTKGTLTLAMPGLWPSASSLAGLAELRPEARTDSGRVYPSRTEPGRASPSARRDERA